MLVLSWFHIATNRRPTIKKIILFVFTLVSFSLWGGGNQEERALPEMEELVANGNLVKGQEGWSLFVNAPAKAGSAAEKEVMIYAIDDLGRENWHVQGQYAGLPLIQGRRYFLSVDMAASIPRTAQVRVQLDGSPYTGYLEEDVELTKKMQTFRFDFTMEEESDEFAILCFNIGSPGDGITESHRVMIDNLSLQTERADTSAEDEDGMNLKVNQLGYMSEGTKKLRIDGESEGFAIKSEAGEILYRGTFGASIDDASSGDMVRIGDFSPVTEAGIYYAELSGGERSVPFAIGDDVYNPLEEALLEMFYYQRCGELLPEEKAGLWSHQACHGRDAYVYGSDQTVDVSGGWHDAGDYGRYVSPGAKAVADLLNSWQFYHRGGSLEDRIIEECRYELDWMLKMQDSAGGVYHKVTTEKFIGNVMPHRNTDRLILSPPSPTATADFAAVMAMSSRLLRDEDGEYSDRALQAAQKAWEWLQAHPDAPGFTNPPGIVTGEYGDGESGDERFWASVELFLATGDSRFGDYAEKSYTGNRWKGLSWMDMGSYGAISWLFSTGEGFEGGLTRLLREDFLAFASELSDKSLADGYGISLGLEYQWGSNGTVADNSIILLLADKLTGDGLYREQARHHLDYLLGVNGLGQCYVTGFGENPVQNPHHRPSSASGSPIPGMLAGGPNMNLQDPLAAGKLGGMPPGKCYIDGEPSYSTNEITIYWNSPLFFLVSAISR